MFCQHFLCSTAKLLFFLTICIKLKGDKHDPTLLNGVSVTEGAALCVTTITGEVAVLPVLLPTLILFVNLILCKSYNEVPQIIEKGLTRV